MNDDLAALKRDIAKTHAELRQALARIDAELAEFHKLFMRLRQADLMNVDSYERACHIEPRTAEMRQIAKNR